MKKELPKRSIIVESVSSKEELQINEFALSLN